MRLRAIFGCLILSPLLAVAASPDSRKPAYRALIADPDKQVVANWAYGGGEMKPATMIFWNNGLLTVRSEIFSAKPADRHFIWKLLAEKNGALLSIEYADERLAFQTSSSTEEYHRLNHPGLHAVRIDPATRTIVYALHDCSWIMFNNWRFDGKPLANCN